jgi:O-antigen ligase
MARTTETSFGPARSPFTAFLQSGGVLVLALLLGLGAGLAVALDHRLSLLFEPVRDWARVFPFLLSAALVVGAVGITLLHLSGRQLFERRFAVAIVVVLVCGAASGLNAGRIEMSDLAMLLIVGFFFATALVERHPIRLPMWLLIVVLMLMGCSLASVLNGGFGSFLAQRSFINKCVLILATASIVATAGLTLFVVRLLPALAVISAVLAIGSLIVYQSTGISLIADDIAAQGFKDTPFGRLPRATALMPTSQSLAHLLLLGLSSLLFLPIRPVLRVLGAGVVCFAIGCTFSTGAYVTMALVMVAFPFIMWPQRSLHFLTAYAASGLVAYYSGAAHWIYDTLIVPLGGKGAGDRVTYLQTGLEVIQQYPVFGIGLRAIGRSLTSLVHNAYVQLTAELGIPAGVLFTGMIAFVTITAGLAAFKRLAGDMQLAMKGLFLGMLALGIHFLFEPFYDNYFSWAYLGLVAGAVAGLSTNREIGNSIETSPLARRDFGGRLS